MNKNYEAVIGIEVHVQLKTKSKIFSSDATVFDAGDNENISPVTLGMPGTLPVLNIKVVELAAKTGLALNCSIREKSVFARKNYFYPDLPKGYQISQFDQPLCENGYLEFTVEDSKKRVSITRAHIEEDAGKSTHFPQYSLINYNRAGMPLLEIVSGPDMRSAAEAAEYCRQLRSIVRFIDVCDGNLEEGSLRCDCNVSIRKRGETQLGTKVELKNLNSFRFIEKAIEFEIDRQIDLLETGKNIVQETRLYDPDKNRTYTMRVKEDAEDYRYFSDPDLLPIVINQQTLENLKQSIPELPLRRKERYMTDWGLSRDEAHILTQEKDLCEYFEATEVLTKNAKASANWILSDVLRVLNEDKIELLDFKVKPDQLAQIINLVLLNKISMKNAKTVFNEAVKADIDILKFIKEQGYDQSISEENIKTVITEVIQKNTSQVQDYLNGKEKVLGFLIGLVMKETKGKASPDIVTELLKKEIEKNK